MCLFWLVFMVNPDESYENSIYENSGSLVSWTGSYPLNSLTFPGENYRQVVDNRGLSANDPWEVPRNCLQARSMLGEGCFGQVWMCEVTNDKGKYCDSLGLYRFKRFYLEILKTDKQKMT